MTVRETTHDHRHRAIFVAQAHHLGGGGAHLRVDRAEIPGLRGLVRKYYLRSEDGYRAGGVYLWETRAAAEAVYNSEWKARVKQLYGSEPEISWFDTPVIVDNQAGGAITKAA